MELTRTCCFEFDRKKGPESKQLFLHTFCFYFRLVGFTYLLPLPEVDKRGRGGLVVKRFPGNQEIMGSKPTTAT